MCQMWLRVAGGADEMLVRSMQTCPPEIQTFKRELENDPLASLRVEPAIVMYGWGEVFRLSISYARNVRLHVEATLVVAL